MKMKLLQPPEFAAKEHGAARCSNGTSARYGQKARHRRQHRTPCNLAQTYRRMNRHAITAERRFSFPPLFPLGRAKHRRKLWVSVDTHLGCDVFAANLQPRLGNFRVKFASTRLCRHVGSRGRTRDPVWVSCFLVPNGFGATGQEVATCLPKP